MSNAETVIEEIGLYLEKSSLKKSNITKEELIAFIETKWEEADDEKYNIHQGCIYIGRMTNEYIWAKDFDNMMRWLAEDDKHTSSQKHEAYIRNYYKGQCCLECGNEEKALEFFNLSYAENPDYIFERAPFCYEFFNRHLENPRELNTEFAGDELETDYYIELDYWKAFFEEDGELCYHFLDRDGEIIEEPSVFQEKGISYLEDHQEEILHNMLSELLKIYPDLQKAYDYPEDYKKDCMPDVRTIRGFSGLLSPTIFYVTSVIKDDYPYIGFSFNCPWDVEHDLGFMVHKDRVVEIGDAALAFDISAAENDAELNKNIPDN